MNQKKIEGLMKEILKFRDKRDWAQFQDSKNTACLKRIGNIYGQRYCTNLIAKEIILES